MDLPNRDDEEATLIYLLLGIFHDWGDALLRRIIIAWDGFRARVEAALRERLASVFLSTVLRFDPSSPFLPAETFSAASAVDWAANHASATASEVVTRTQQLWTRLQTSLVTGAVRATITPSPEDVAKILGEQRAKSIAVTEITRAHSAGTRFVVTQIEAAAGELLPLYWYTNRDERVCPICRPLHRQPHEVWRLKFPLGPPAHPICRCFLSRQLFKSG